MQEIKCKWINTKELLENYLARSKNLDTVYGDLRLSSTYEYRFEAELPGHRQFNITDLAVDECGTAFYVGKIEGTDKGANSIFKYEKDTDFLSPVDCSLEAFPLKLEAISAVGVSRDTLYIADLSEDNARLIALTKRGLQLRWVLSKGLKGEDLGEILDIGIDSRGYVYILEKEKNRVLEVDTKSPLCPEPQLSCELDGTEKAKGLALTAEGDRYLLSRNRLHIFRAGNAAEEKIIEIEGFSPEGIAVDAWGQVFLGETSGPLGNQSPEYEKTIHMLGLDDRFYPLWSYRGLCSKLAYGPGGRLYVLDGSGYKITLLMRKEVNLKGPEGLFRGTYVSKPMDSRKNGTLWHRLLLEGDFGKGTQLEFFYYVSDEKPPGQGEKIPDEEQWTKCISEASAVQGSTKRDALFLKKARGRYLWFKVVLSGTENLSPKVRSVGIFFPRVSYLDYLPAVYREDPASKDLLERFLSIFESIFFEIDYSIEHIVRFFDALGAPPAFLSWLGVWLAVPMDEDWPEEQKRLFIKNAISLYKMRGTREGLEKSIELFTGKKPFIVENFRINRPCKVKRPLPEGHFQSGADGEIYFPPVEASVKVGEKEIPLVNFLFGTEKFGFCVFLEDPGLDRKNLDRLRRIIEEQKPAHTSGGLRVLEPWFNLDMHTYLGINTRLTKSEFVLGTSSAIGRDTVLDDEEKAGQVERHSRVGIDAVLS